MSRIVFATGLVAAAWALAIGGSVAVGDARAEAAWLKDGTGSAGAKALQLAVPASFSVTPAKCNGNNKSVNIGWAAVTGALSYEVYATDSTGGRGQVLTTTTATGLTGYDLPYKPAVITVRGLNNKWRGQTSPTATGCP
ncbi:hypothetical protein [Amycolatopsis sp. MEPSY49]|uniref:hypothetical protein n=1 Tax=Amycolatopsis sp. MEPSY49 TaxID=3151600 RepID=UPI003EF15B39